MSPPSLQHQESILPAAPLASTLSPDIEPLFPSPAGAAYSPSDSSLPTIPSTPSPPNPEVYGTPSPVIAFPPSQSMPVYARASHSSSSLPLNLILLYLFSLYCCFASWHVILHLLPASDVAASQFNLHRPESGTDDVILCPSCSASSVLSINPFFISSQHKVDLIHILERSCVLLVESSVTGAATI
ncbi:classical arabinogalactan protein 26 [Senna tora]|uniref:Classical arabinogalactan protein 26 n=1 Tax=Senna tora TaxID=362788 RepID=A0A834SV27_9FABA|nr:classical arabinogalactan protein 26 [Senna tora]